MADTTIEWTRGDDGSKGKTWNPIRGCSVVSPGCEHCYAMGMAARFSDPGQAFQGFAHFSAKRRLPQWTGKVAFLPEHLADPISWRQPKRVFVNSTSDLFHEELSDESIAAIFGVMAATPQHTYLILTKRARRMREWFKWVDREKGARRLGLVLHHAQRAMPVEVAQRTSDIIRTPDPILRRRWPLDNVWLGVSAEDQQRADERVPDLILTPAAVRFVSYEPALGPVDFTRWLAIPDETDDLRDDPLGFHLLHEAIRDGLADAARALSWIIVGGESGPRARPFDVAWARSIVKQCANAGVACFVKQLGSHVRTNGIQMAGDWWPRLTREIAGGQSGLVEDGEGLGGAAFRKYLVSKKGTDMTEWPPSLRVRQFPRPSRSTAAIRNAAAVG